MFTTQNKVGCRRPRCLHRDCVLPHFVAKHSVICVVIQNLWPDPGATVYLSSHSWWIFKNICNQVLQCKIPTNKETTFNSQRLLSRQKDPLCQGDPVKANVHSWVFGYWDFVEERWHHGATYRRTISTSKSSQTLFPLRSLQRERVKQIIQAEKKRKLFKNILIVLQNHKQALSLKTKY